MKGILFKSTTPSTDGCQYPRGGVDVSCTTKTLRLLRSHINILPLRPVHPFPCLRASVNFRATVSRKGQFANQQSFRSEGNLQQSAVKRGATSSRVISSLPWAPHNFADRSTFNGRLCPELMAENYWRRLLTYTVAIPSRVQAAHFFGK